MHTGSTAYSQITVMIRKTRLYERPAWYDHAPCRGATDLFFPVSADIRDAARICRTCPYRVVCLQYALDHGIDQGVWGGTSERERVKMRRRLQKEAANA